MEGFMPYFIGSIAASLLSAIVVFASARRMLKVRLVINLFGALLAAIGVFMAFGWWFTVTGVFARTVDPAFGGVPWQVPATWFVLAIIWYMLPWFVRRQLDWIVPWWKSR